MQIFYHQMTYTKLPQKTCVSEYEKSKPSVVFPYHNILTHILKHINQMTTFSELLKRVHPNNKPKNVRSVMLTLCYSLVWTRRFSWTIGGRGARLLRRWRRRSAAVWATQSVVSVQRRPPLPSAQRTLLLCSLLSTNSCPLPKLRCPSPR